MKQYATFIRRAFVISKWIPLCCGSVLFYERDVFANFKLYSYRRALYYHTYKADFISMLKRLDLLYQFYVSIGHNNMYVDRVGQSREQSG